jgi:hypothetical protein
MKKKCEYCISFTNCYPLSYMSDKFPQSIVEYFNAIRRRDLCVNDDKSKFLDRRVNFERRKSYRKQLNKNGGL